MYLELTPRSRGSRETRPRITIENDEKKDGARPVPPRNLADTGLSESFLLELVLKLVYYSGTSTGTEIAADLCVPFHSIVEPVLAKGRTDGLVETKGGGSSTAATWRYALTTRGRDFCQTLLDRNRYVGAAPVPVEQYRTVVESLEPAPLDQAAVRAAFSDLVLEDHVLDRIGTAVSARRSTFLHGSPGNGKSSIADRMVRLLKAPVYVPRAIEVGGQVIKVFDPLIHRPFEEHPVEVAYDRRWVPCHPPKVLVGGELTLDMLDLRYSADEKTYEAPFQLRSNGGILVVEDLGRQRTTPRDLLNRWIVPLEKGIDFLTLHTGKKFEVPFRQIVVFTTNLDPGILADEAFLRRLRYKIELRDPTEATFRSIWRAACASREIPHSDDALEYLIQSYYKKHRIRPRASHPGELLDLIIDRAHYLDRPPRLDRTAVDEACGALFVA